MNDDRERDAEDLAGERLVSIRNVPDEATATLLCDFLRSQGIEANAVPVQMPWFGTIETMRHGYWGRIEVLEKDRDRAGALVEDYMSASPEVPGEEES